MKKLGLTFLIAGAVVVVFGLLAKLLPGISIEPFTFGFLCGLGSTLLVGGLLIWGLSRFGNRKEQKI